MNEETAKTASELLKRKSALVADQAILCKDSPNYVVVGYTPKDAISYYGPLQMNSYKDLNLGEIFRAAMYEKVVEEIAKVDEKLKNLTCV